MSGLGATIKAGLRAALLSSQFPAANDVLAVGVSPPEVTAAYPCYEAVAMGEALYADDEPFLLSMHLPSFDVSVTEKGDRLRRIKDRALLQEVFTSTEPIMKEAKRRGHRVASSMRLPEYDFKKAGDRKRAEDRIAKEDPYALMLAFPFSLWSQPMRLLPERHRPKLEVRR